MTYNIDSNTKVISESSGQTVAASTINTGDRVYLKTIAKNSKTLSLIVIKPTLASSNTSSNPTPAP